jgi:hypothetical protein
MVPNQHISFPDGKKPMVEDEFIAYTWDKFLRTGNEMWPARLPMTKSAVRAHGCDHGVHERRRCGQGECRDLRGRRRIEARLDHLDNRRCRQTRGRDRAPW